MPQALVGIVQLALFAAWVPAALITPLAYGLVYGGLAFGAYALQKALMPKTTVPSPDDGSYNLKQNVPSLPYVLGNGVKKGGDYVFLESSEGTAFHIVVLAGHRCGGIIQHYLHDEAVTLDANGYVVGPEHFQSKVRILTRLGDNVGVAYQPVIDAFPEIWTDDHRGDGLTSVMMEVKTVPSSDHLHIFPNQMPQISSVVIGYPLYDPRLDDTVTGGAGSNRFADPSTWTGAPGNLALQRLWHITDPVGGKLSIADLYLPEWMHAADVADGFVINRKGVVEPRWHGAFWFRAENSPVDVGSIIDAAGEMVVYERADGLVGVHAGEFVEPDIRLVKTDVGSVSIDKNRSEANTVLAVRGRYVNPDNAYNTEDAAIYGNPYAVSDDTTERTKTFSNEAINSHNHCQRKQKLTMIRTNARKVSFVATYESAKNCAYRRFVRVHYPPKLVEAIIEITETPTVNLRDMTVSVSGIIVGGDLYDFDAATEEGTPGGAVDLLEPSAVPQPVGVTVVVINEVLAGGSSAARLKATWTHYSDALTYQLEYERTDGSSPAQSVYSAAGDDQVLSEYLADGAEYRYRLRAWGGGSRSAWTEYDTLIAIADPVAPGAVSEASVSPGEGLAMFEWTAPNSANYFACRIYISETANIANAALVATEFGAPSMVDQRTITSLEAGTYYGWLIAINASGSPADAVSVGGFEVA